MSFSSELTDVNRSEPYALPRKFYDSFLSDPAKSRKPSPIWDLLPIEQYPGVLSLLAGKPNPETFPFTSLSVNIRSPHASDEDQVTKVTLSDEELSVALQYGCTAGIPVLIDWLTIFMKHVHGGKDNEGWRLSVCPGAQDGIYKAVSALLNNGDPVLVQEPLYPSAIPIFRALEARVIPVVSDADGVVPASIENILENWPTGKPKPKLFYTIPYGSNPSGVTTSEERRIEILRLARRHDFIILEDDPYFHLYFGTKPRPASYFNLERRLGGQVGRVLRIDSFSKILSSGFRIGWVTGPSVFIDVIDNHSSISTVQCSSLTQSLVYKVVSMWGISGFLDHTARVSEFYRVKRDLFEASMRRHLMGLAEWTTPDAGLFYWVKLLLPASSDPDVEGDSLSLCRERGMKKKILLLPGTCAFFDDRRSPYVRLAFSLLPEACVDEALKRLASAVREEWDAVVHTKKL